MQTKFKMVNESYVDDFESEVNSLLQEGWQLIPNVVAVHQGTPDHNGCMRPEFCFFVGMIKNIRQIKDDKA